MPRYRVRRHRWYRVSDEVDVEAKDEMAAHYAAKGLCDEPEPDQLEFDDFETDTIDEIGEFGLRVDSGNRTLFVTPLCFETKGDAYDVGQGVWVYGLAGLGEVKPEWRVPEIRNPDITWVEVVGKGGEVYTVFHPNSPKFMEVA